MPNRQLFENWDSVLLFAFVGTIWNTLAIGFSLYLLGQLNLFSVAFSNFEILLFASLISAVDPVAVIAVFEEIHVNEFLFINVFGEALFNDGVSVVLYQMFRKFTLIGVNNLAVFDYIAGIFSFVVIALGVEKADLDYEAMMVEKVYNKYFDYTMAGIEDIIGQRGRHFFRDSFERFNAKLIKPLLMRHVKRKAFDASDIVRAYNKITLTEAVKIAQYMASQDNMEALYTMFSRLLDRKVDELKRIQSEGSERRENNDDIKDDYMDILITKVQLNQQQQPSISVINTNSYSTRGKTDNNLNVNVRNVRH
uniref:Cation/H+ exchanger domain-containing protein n=1 Tax=Meloidogyne javanica TaxID=6303 RepID=A0A915LWW2_MELJA